LADTPIRVGVVGLGAFGTHHARHYASHPRAQLVAVADVDFDRARDAAAQFGGEPFVNVRELVGNVSAVSIAVPASAHAAVARDFLDAGIHVLIEKPLATNTADAQDLVARAERAGAVLQVGHIERYSPAIDELKTRLSAPRRMSFVRRVSWSGRSTDVDVVFDLMIHDIDLALALAGAPVSSVAASGEIIRSGLVDEAEAWLTFANGVIATLSASRVAERNERKLSVTELERAFTADLAAPALSVATRTTWGSEPEAIALADRDNLAAEIDGFLACIAAGSTPQVDGRAGLAAVEVAERIQAAIADADLPARRSFA
jgi:predicted dehydrogenase